jgi:hypothetical protein
MASYQVLLPAWFGTHMPGRRTTQTARSPRLLTHWRFSMSVGQARRGRLVYCNLTMRSGLRYIHHSRIPQLILVSYLYSEIFSPYGLTLWQVGNAPLARVVLSQQHTRPFSASVSQFSSCLLLDLQSFATVLVKQIIPMGWTISVFISSCVPL